MRTVRTKIYKFEELSDKAKQVAINWGYDLNVSHDWWDFTYEDAAAIGLKITSFDIGRGRDITGKLTEGIETCIKLIMENHGEASETYKLAEKHKSLVAAETMKAAMTEDEAYLDDIEDDFLKELLNAYWLILSNEYDYLTSEEAIVDTIIANEYEFTEDGNRF